MFLLNVLYNSVIVNNLMLYNDIFTLLNDNITLKFHVIRYLGHVVLRLCHMIFNFKVT